MVAKSNLLRRKQLLLHVCVCMGHQCRCHFQVLIMNSSLSSLYHHHHRRCRRRHHRNKKNRIHSKVITISGAWWLIDQKGGGFESRSSRHVLTFGKSFTRNCLWRFGVKLRHSIRAVSGALQSSSGLEEAL